MAFFTFRQRSEDEALKLFETATDKYRTDDTGLLDAYTKGLHHGSGFTANNVPEAYKGDTVESLREKHAENCYAAEENSRCFSPFEFTAYAFNQAENSEALWEAFDAGWQDRLVSDLALYDDCFYDDIINDFNESGGEG
jgi:hypothetical protein